MDFANLDEVTGFELQVEHAGGEGGIHGGGAVAHVDDIATALGDDFRNGGELTGLIRQAEANFGTATAGLETTINHAAKDIDVDVTAREQAADLLALQFGNLVINHGGHRDGTRAFADEFALFN